MSPEFHHYTWDNRPDTPEMATDDLTINGTHYTYHLVDDSPAGAERYLAALTGPDGHPVATLAVGNEPNMDPCEEGFWGFGPDDLYVLWIGVSPKQRRQGLATALMDATTARLGRIHHAPHEHRTTDGLAWSNTYDLVRGHA